jgi:benzoyl-CoA reductase/2-hydroxyglutaryl-CoA dehydratase subunit BcrC/BadD/HgdB
LKRQKIPSLTIEIDDTSLALGQVETRVQAFLEMVGDFQW